VFLFHNKRLLAYDTFNVMRDPDRTRLGNKALKRLPPAVAALYPEWMLQRDLDLFGLKVDSADEEMFDAEDVAGKDHPLEYYLEPYVVRGGGTIIFAPPGSTKSFLGLIMGVSVDSGISGFWRTYPHKTLLINLERSRESMENRLWRVNHACGLPRDRKLLMINARGKSMTNIAAAAQRVIKRYSVEFVILDSISRAGGNLNDNEDANAVMDVLNGFGGAWLAIGHSPRADSTHVFGSQMFDAAADLTVQVLSEKKGAVTGVGLKMIKSNDIPLQDLEMLALEFDEGGLTKIRKTTPGEFTDLSAAKKVSLTDEICDVMPEQSGLTDVEVYNKLQARGVKCTAASVRVTLYNGAKDGTFRNWKAGGVVLWNVLNL
ncbi:MAG: AAA family ATPase, partial [Candidatus Omnitrophota bacterium]|nr:AAA family ATPase [Candidatus Omnitrophota bacterium]